jgi:hypothetical protein
MAIWHFWFYYHGYSFSLVFHSPHWLVMGTCRVRANGTMGLLWSTSSNNQYVTALGEYKILLQTPSGIKWSRCVYNKRFKVSKTCLLFIHCSKQIFQKPVHAMRIDWYQIWWSLVWEPKLTVLTQMKPVTFFFCNFRTGSILWENQTSKSGSQGTSLQSVGLVYYACLMRWEAMGGDTQTYKNPPSWF